MNFKRTPSLSSRILAQVKKGNLSPLEYETLFRVGVRSGCFSLNDLMKACYNYEQRVVERMCRLEQENPGIGSKCELADAQTLAQAYRISIDGLSELSNIPGAVRAAAAVRYYNLQAEIDRLCAYRRGLVSHAHVRFGTIREIAHYGGSE